MTKESTLLYKYRDFDRDALNLRTISHAEFWFASANSLNDPFDADFQFNFDGLDSDIAEKWVRSAVPAEAGDARAMEVLTEFRTDPGVRERMYQDFLEYTYRRFGICSLAGSKDNLLLWAHHADKHKGFCVGLSKEILEEFVRDKISKGTLLELVAVCYTQLRYIPNFFKTMLHPEDTFDISKIIGTKSIHWSYEGERRLVLWDKSNIAEQLGHDTIREVILGCRISPENKERIISLCKEHVPHAAVLQAIKDPQTFSLVFDRIM